jgi:hypothetical protein
MLSTILFFIQALHENNDFLGISSPDMSGSGIPIPLVFTQSQDLNVLHIISNTYYNEKARFITQPTI